ncbi:hypothetical protein OGM63_02350 [Plectonema radiosum NIES-515]|uniref:ILEI/PANDER domain-containing protein n=1 Tax=Plectonema radiosum NIES-515 TaxID=2986073 RepID=A0ABT3ATC9_9CYAN|nr:interleukin-like EMT inducer domain-containing protein [Plectonema radiosum]MCV3212381.1 hypothetical protein [Plectonema radiosum NIES-515]
MSNITFTLKVESAGAKGGNFARISINGTDIGLISGRGLNVAVFDQTTGQVLSKANFDTFLPGNAPRFADFIKSVPTGQIVALAVKDDAIANLYTEAYDAVVQAFLSIGSTKFGDLQFQGSWALIGQKGGFADATEELSPSSPVTVTRSFYPTSPPPIELPVPQTQTRWLEIQRIFETNPGWDASRFGTATATSGQWLIVGAHLDDIDGVAGDAGAAFIFQLQNDGSWLQKQRLQPRELKAADYFGYSVDINGEWAIVGTVLSDVVKPDGGAAYMFHLESGVWVQKDRLAPPDLKAGDYFGDSVAIDGDWAIVGVRLAEAPNVGDGGAAYIFHLENGEWKQKQKLQPPELKSNDWFGQCVDINGEWAIVGARLTDIPGVAGDAGAAYIFHLENGEWKQKHRLQPPELKTDWFGHSVAITGEWAFVGAPYADALPGKVDTGAVYVFHLENGEWKQKLKLQPDDLRNSDWFGNAVTINGNLAVVGAKGLDGITWDNSGGAYIFRLENGEWKQEHRFIADRMDSEYVSGLDSYDKRSVSLTSWGVAFLGAPLTRYRAKPGGGHGEYGSVYVLGQR